MGFIKKNAFLLGCAVVGIVSLGLVIWGMSGMSKVGTEMDKSKRLHGELDRVAKKPSNPQGIEFEKQRILLIREYHGKVMAHFRNRCVRTALVENLLPDPGKGPRGKNLRYEFRSQYRQAMKSLLVRLNAGQPPAKEEIDDTADYLRKKAMEEAEFANDDQEASPGAGPGRGGRGGKTVGSGFRGSGSQKDTSLPERKGPGSTKAYWQALAERAKSDPTMLASISKARQIYCYAVVGRGGSFELSQIYVNTDEAAPSMADIWYAQLWYWIQQDIVEALASVNDRAAAEILDQKAKADDAARLGQAKMDEPWVGNLPIKDVLSIRVSDYIVDTGDSRPPTAGRRTESPDRPPEHPDAAYTHLFSDPLFDVINVRVKIAIDVRQLPVILNEFCHDRYYTVLNVSCRAVPPDLSFTGKLYGPQPVVVATLDLQTYLFYKSYVPLMPLAIREQLGIPEDQFEKLVEELKGSDDGESGEQEAQEGEG